MDVLETYQYQQKDIFNEEYRFFYKKQRKISLRRFLQRKKSYFSFFRKRTFRNKKNIVKSYGFYKRLFVKVKKKRFYKVAHCSINKLRFRKAKYLNTSPPWWRGMFRKIGWWYKKRLHCALKKRWQQRRRVSLRKRLSTKDKLFLGIFKSLSLQRKIYALKKKKVRLVFSKHKFSKARWFFQRKHIYLNVLKYVKRQLPRIRIISNGSKTSASNKFLRLWKKKRFRIRRKTFLKKYLFFVKKTTNNYFFTVTNIFGEVLVLSSMGHAKIKTKKKRKSPEAFKDFVKFFQKKIWKIKLKGKYCLILKKRLRRFLKQFLVWKLTRVRFKLAKVIWSKKKAHNGVKKPKRKRL